jgi:hypothetical protein
MAQDLSINKVKVFLKIYAPLKIISHTPKLYKPTMWSRVLHGKLIVSQLVKKFQSFMEPEGSVPCSQKPTTGHCPEPDKSSPLPPSYFLNIHFNIILQCTPRSSECSLPFRPSNRKWKT